MTRRWHFFAAAKRLAPLADAYNLLTLVSGPRVRGECTIRSMSVEYDVTASRNGRLWARLGASREIERLTINQPQHVCSRLHQNASRAIGIVSSNSARASVKLYFKNGTPLSCGPLAGFLHVHRQRASNDGRRLASARWAARASALIRARKIALRGEYVCCLEEALPHRQVGLSRGQRRPSPVKEERKIGVAAQEVVAERRAPSPFGRPADRLPASVAPERQTATAASLSHRPHMRHRRHLDRHRSRSKLALPPLRKIFA